MEKTSGKKKVSDDATKSKAAYASTGESASPSENNASKYSPTSEAQMDIQSLDPGDGLLKLLTDSIKDLYWAENHLVKALPKMVKSASTPELVDAISNHLEQTRTHVERLEQVFELLGKKPQAKKCDAMEGLTKEGEGVIEDTDQGTPARDLGIIMASQKVEHYEISAYTGLIKLSNKLGLPDVAAILSTTLTEEQESDALLSTIADKHVTIEEEA